MKEFYYFIHPVDFALMTSESLDWLRDRANSYLGTEDSHGETVQALTIYKSTLIEEVR